MTPDVSAVVVNYNGGDDVLRCIASLLEQAGDVVVVDNGSRDGSAEAIARTFGDRIRFERLAQNAGISRGRNIGIALAREPFVLLLDNDAVALTGMVETLRTTLLADPSFDVVGPLILDARDERVVQFGAPTIDRWGFAFDAMTGMAASDARKTALRETFYLPGTALMARRETFLAVGGYDEGIFFGCEDMDLCWRLRLAGYGICAMSTAACAHRGGGSLGVPLDGSLYTPELRTGAYRQSAERITVREANTFRIMVSNLGARNLALYLAVFLPFSLAECLGLLLIGRWRIAAAYLAAFGRMIRGLPAAVRRRRIVQAMRRVPDAAITRFWSRRYEKLTFLRRNGMPALLKTARPLFVAALAVALVLPLGACGGGGGSVTPRAPAGSANSVGPPQASDWSTYGDGVERQGYNASETTLTSGNVGSLALQWKRNLGAAIDAQPLYAAAVTIHGVQHDVVYAGTEAGAFYALDAQTGATLWAASLGTLSSGCDDLENGRYGVTGTPVFDRTSGRIYVPDGQDKVHALSMTTGKEISGWPVVVTANTSQEHIYGALAYDAAAGTLYAETASYCDITPYQGRLVAISTASASVTATFLPSGSESGAGMWGMGGPSIDPASGDVFVATGNTFGATAHDDYGEQVVQLTPSLAVVAANYPILVSGTADYDFGATPMLYQAPSCAEQVTAKNKDGTLYLYDVASIAAGPSQSLDMAQPTESGQFIGVTSYDPVTNMVYVGDTGTAGAFEMGLVALAVQPDCSLALAWQSPEGSPTGDSNNIGATIADGVVYSTDGPGNEVFANDAATGAALWNSGGTTGGPLFTPPTVTGGRLYVGGWDDTLYAFGLP